MGRYVLPHPVDAVGVENGGKHLGRSEVNSSLDHVLAVCRQRFRGQVDHRFS